jgi:hypothetical protein
METRYIKSLDDIRQIGKVHERSVSTYRIVHSGAEGGGLFVKRHRVEQYFGTQEPVEMELYRQLRCVYLAENGWWLYGEWLYDRDNYIIESLPEDLFEI